MSFAKETRKMHVDIVDLIVLVRALMGLKTAVQPQLLTQGKTPVGRLSNIQIDNQTLTPLPVLYIIEWSQTCRFELQEFETQDYETGSTEPLGINDPRLQRHCACLIAARFAPSLVGLSPLSPDLELIPARIHCNFFLPPIGLFSPDTI